MMTKNNSLDKLNSNYEQTNTKLLISQRNRRTKSQVTSNKNQDASIKNGITTRVSAKKKKSCESPAQSAFKNNKEIFANSSSAETTTDSTSTICKEKFLDKLDLHVKPKESQLFTCEFCEEEFPTENYLNLHVFRAHKDIISFKTTKVTSNSSHKSKSASMRDKVRRFTLLRQRYEAASAQMGKFSPRFVTRVSEERKRRRKLFREQIQTSTKKNSNESCEKISEAEDKSNLQVPTSTVEIDENSKDNAADNPTSSDINEFKSESKEFIDELQEFVLSNGDVNNLSNIEEDDDSKDILALLSSDGLTFELPSRPSGQHEDGNNSIKVKAPDDDDDDETLKVKTASESEKLKVYLRKNNVKASRRNSKNQGYCDSCSRSLALLDTHYQTDSTGARKIHCTFCSHKFISVNGLYRHVALYHLNCSCIRNKCHWYNPFTIDKNQLGSAARKKTYHCNYCSKDYEDFKKYNFHHYTFHELEPVSDELVIKTPKYLKDLDSNYLTKRWVASASKTNFFGKKHGNGEYDEEYDVDNGIDILWPIVCQKCGELYFNSNEYTVHLDNCYYRFDLAPVTPITEYPEEIRPVEELRESSLKPETSRKIDFVVKPNIKLQFFPQDIKSKPRNPRKFDTNYDLLRRTCRRCNKPFGTVRDLSIHYQLVHQNSANNKTNDKTNNNINNNNNTGGKVNSNDKNPSGNNKVIKTKKDYDDENNIKYYNYKNTPWYGHNVRHKWQCVHCKLSFKIFRAFSNHLFFEHNDESLIHICENCDGILTNLDQINKHLCVNVTAWTCKLCDLRFDSGLEFRAHNTKNHYELFEPSVCLACGKKFLTHYMLLRHVKNKKCSSEKVIDDLISTYSKKPKKVNPPAAADKKKKEKTEAASNYIIIVNDPDETEAENGNKKKEVEGADGVFELVDCSAGDFAFDLNQDADLNKIDVLATPEELEEKTEVVSDEVEEIKEEEVQIQETESETVKEPKEEATNDEDNVADEEVFDDIPMDDDSVIEDTNDEDSDDGSEDDDDEDDDDFDDEDLDDEELDDEEFDDDESVDIVETEDSKASENNYNELVQINNKCNKVITMNEDTYDELAAIKNYVLEEDVKLVDSVGNKRKKNDDSFAAKKKKLTDIHDTFTAQVDQLSNREKGSVNRTPGTSHKAACQINRCSMCKLQFSSMALLSSHFNRTHTSAVEICQLCFKMYITGNLVKHMVKDHYSSWRDFVDELVVVKDEISIERDTREFINIVGKVQLLALCKYQEPPQASSEESVDCSDCSLTFENSDKYRIHNVEVHDKFCALCITKFRNGSEAAKHKLDAHGSTACYVWFASKMINAIGDTDTFKEAVGLKAKKRKPKNPDEVISKSRNKSRSRNIDNDASNINDINDTMSNVSPKQESMTLKDKIVDILRKSQPTLDRLNSRIQSTRNRQQTGDKQTEDNLQGVLQIENDVKPKTPIKSPGITKNKMQIENRQSSGSNPAAIKSKKLKLISPDHGTLKNESIIIKCGFLKKDGQNSNNDNEDERQILIVVEKNDLRKYKNNLQELAEKFVASTNMSTEQMVRILQAQLDNM